MENSVSPKPRDDFRNFAAPARDSVREFYRQNHAQQTHAFVLAKKADYLRFNRREMTWWEALDYLDTLVDDSDPDIALPQFDHLLQTAEAMLPWVQKFNPYDLYSKNPVRPRLADLRLRYDDLMAKYLPATVRF